MKIDLTDKQMFDIEWSILVAISSVEKQKKAEGCIPLQKKLLKLHDVIYKARTGIEEI
tara:strand:- start:1279 stop:1452 length:174 start_codon:yes stop_codon:yes gene_type:complete